MPLAFTILASLGAGACIAEHDPGDPSALAFADDEDAGLQDIDESGIDKAAAKSLSSFANIFIVGDSLSDQSRLGSGYIPYCPNAYRGYWNYRFTNGYLWVDYLTQDNPAIATKVRNYAVGGAGVLSNGGGGLIGKLEKQASDLASKYQDKNGKLTNSMVIVWAGANDIKEARKTGNGADFGRSVFNTMKSKTIDVLAAKGVTDFVLMGLPPLDRVPGTANLTSTQRKWVADAVNTFNTELRKLAWSKAYVWVPIAGKINDVLDGRITTVNMTDTTTPCSDAPNCAVQVDRWGSYRDMRCPGKMFFDKFHPTTGAHCGITKWVEQAMADKYTLFGQNQSLDSCAMRVQTATATWGRLPTSRSTPRTVQYRVRAALNPSSSACTSACSKTQGSSLQDRGNVKLTNGTQTGYCSCQLLPPLYGMQQVRGLVVGELVHKMIGKYNETRPSLSFGTYNGDGTITAKQDSGYYKILIKLDSGSGTTSGISNA